MQTERKKRIKLHITPVFKIMHSKNILVKKSRSKFFDPIWVKGISINQDSGQFPGLFYEKSLWRQANLVKWKVKCHVFWFQCAAKQRRRKKGDKITEWGTYLVWQKRLSQYRINENCISISAKSGAWKQHQKSRDQQVNGIKSQTIVFDCLIFST
jgi:hypothetical protein